MSKEVIANNYETSPISSSNDWLANMPEEIRKAESLGKFKDVSSLAHSYLEAEKSLNQRVAVPKDDSSDEEWHKFYCRLGLPEDKRYTDKRSKEDEEYLTRYEDMFYQSSLSKRQGEKLLNSLYGFSQDLQKQQQNAIEQTSHIGWLKDTYGEGFDNKMTVMQAALSKFGTKELAELIEGTNYAPALVDLLVRVGETLKSDSLVTGKEFPAINSREAALSEIEKLDSDPEFVVKLRTKDHTGHDQAVKRMQQLYKIAYDKKQ
ncbi:MAG: hypothetical protein DMENIID0002_12910 [Rickettsia endosymbiont of Sergentomyia squamirostris]|uniref:Uncharacterized protein n=1 Tax=Candidatus Tisiphia endosymbiont of Sergentomyia squamirostris TaxID=3113639 RepID=A0AAT9GA00_9RICK